ncbi:MarR family winged helix-turn-helix transcriptional regulator [Crateriforma conspicua]|uniref:MarR family winged helix-turn-helix transcriptional regulator n=1 Tax=Crateriforma conspicua TaxID=2527996 RepID=UPI001189991F|nr:MarR family winged helix-turn-helix transcriptional regulator [Crateriforma conspicua]QDV65726.1 HTH-type transcriptional regulator MgrA [Crateriforma conspicua]
MSSQPQSSPPVAADPTAGNEGAPHRPPPTPADPLSLENQIVASIRKIIRAVDLHSRHLVGGHGLTGPQLAVLQVITGHAPISPSAVAKQVHLSQATVTGIVQRLEKRQLVARQPSQSDRRSVLITPTTTGQDLLAASPSLLQDRFREALSGLEPWEQTQMLATLQRIASLMDADAIDAAPHLTPGDITVDDSRATRSGEVERTSQGDGAEPTS